MWFPPRTDDTDRRARSAAVGSWWSVASAAFERDGRSAELRRTFGTTRGTVLMKTYDASATHEDSKETSPSRLGWSVTGMGSHHGTVRE